MIVLVLSRDPSNFLQDSLKTLVLFGFDNLLLPSQKSRYLQRKIKPFQLRNAGFWSHRRLNTDDSSKCDFERLDN